MATRLYVSRFQGQGKRGGGTIAERPVPNPELPASEDLDEDLPAPSSENLEPTPVPETPEAPKTKAIKPGRLASLDAFRGLTILGMMLVNNISLGAHTPAQLLHAEWSGQVHMADLVFPWFLFIVGVAVPYSEASARRKHLSQWQYDAKALWRAGMLVFLGCLIDSCLAHRPVFDLGVLQIIGLAYFTAVLVGGLLNLPGRLLLAGALLVGNWAILKLIPFPGHPAGTFTEDANIIKYVNGTYLAPYHLNGLLSLIPTTAMVLIGTAVGDLLRRKKIAPLAKMGTMLVCGAGMVAMGYLWSHKLLGEWGLPMNKPCWSAPYILYTGGWGMIGLSLMYGLIDLTPGKTAVYAALPLLILGMNAIVAYVGPILTKVVIWRNITTTWPTGQAMNFEDALHQWFYSEFGRMNGGWAYTFAYIGVWWLVLLFLYRKRWFLRV